MTQESVGQIDISQTLPAITCDYDGLKAWAQSVTDKYEGLLVTEEQVKDIKKDMAEINKAKQKIERARIDAVKTVSAPIRDFEARIKEVCAIFDAAYNALALQVKEIEATARERKQKEILALFKEQIAAALAENPFMEGKFQVEFPANWLNKTFTMKAIGEEINESIRRQIEAESTRIREKKAQEERLFLIEKTVGATCEKYGVSMPVAVFMTPMYTRLDTDAEMVVDIIERAIRERAETIKANSKERLEKLDRSENESPLISPVYEVSNVRINDAPVQPAPEQTSNLIMLRLVAMFTPEQEDKVREILNQNHFMRIVRQLKAIDVDVDFSRVAADETV